MARDPTNPLLLTPGPVSVSATTKAVMMVDRPSGDVEFLDDIAFARSYLVALIHGQDRYTAIPVPGSATYANEAAITTLVPPGGKVLIHSNGVYGDRLIEIASHLQVPHAVIRTAPFTPATPEPFADALMTDPAITHVMVVHCETSTGILNPLEPIADLCRRAGKGFLIDAVASFGAIGIDARTLHFDAVMLSSNKCMQGVPGVGWAVVRLGALGAAKGNSRSLTLDLWEQDQYLERTGLFRYTPPTQVVAAFAQACREHEAEGGAPGRLARYQRNWRRLIDGMRQMGFTTVVPDAFASPIVATFHNPDHKAFSFQALFEGMKRRGFIIFPGRLALENTFRIGCMGAVTEADIADAMEAVAETMQEMGVTELGRPAAS
jgi:2-aminoethylphosphonate-pyruvate transaminase